jgi:hypothetical protein
MEKDCRLDVILEHTFNTPITEHALLKRNAACQHPWTDGIYVGSQIPTSRTRLAQPRLAGGAGADRGTVDGRATGQEDIAGQIMLLWPMQPDDRSNCCSTDSMLVHRSGATQIG